MFGKVRFDPTGDYPSCAIEDQLAALGEAVAAGKVRHVGLSNETPWGLMRFLGAAGTSLPRVVSLQSAYSLTCRSFDHGLAECCHREGVGFMAYSPLAAGLLTGKYEDDKGGPPSARWTWMCMEGLGDVVGRAGLGGARMGTIVFSGQGIRGVRADRLAAMTVMVACSGLRGAGGGAPIPGLLYRLGSECFMITALRQNRTRRLPKRWGHDSLHQLQPHEPPTPKRAPTPRLNLHRERYSEDGKRYARREPVVAAVRQYAELAREWGLTPAEMALAWVLNNSLVTTAVIGATSLPQLRELIAAAEGRPLDPELLAACDRVHALSPNPTP